MQKNMEMAGTTIKKEFPKLSIMKLGLSRGGIGREENETRFGGCSSVCMGPVSSNLAFGIGKRLQTINIARADTTEVMSNDSYLEELVRGKLTNTDAQPDSLNKRINKNQSVLSNLKPKESLRIASEDISKDKGKTAMS
jgi:hypothetical protein